MSVIAVFTIDIVAIDFQRVNLQQKLAGSKVQRIACTYYL